MKIYANKSRLISLIQNNRGFLLFLLLMFMFRGAVADWSPVPTGSMKPTIQEGDVLWIDKLAYDLKLPYSGVSLVRLGEPERGDIVVFASKAADKRLVKRLIALPGDLVAMRDNVLYVNDERADYQVLLGLPDERLVQEQVLGNSRRIKITARHTRLSSFAPVIVPQGHYMVLGDNRNNSADSRVYGFVPRAEILGRSKRVLLSLDAENFYLPRVSRTWHQML